MGSYPAIADALHRYGAAEFLKADLRELFMRMVFNALCNNRDDHLRNHAFLYDHEHKGWRLSPAFDIVPQPELGPGNPRCLQLELGSYGRQASERNILSQCASFGLAASEAKQVLEEMKAIVREQWKVCAERAQVWRNDYAALGNCYSGIL